MMESEEFSDLEKKLSNGEESRIETHECDNAWQFRSVPEEESEKWKMGKERYDEVIEYIREVDEILDLIRPFPREGNSDYRVEPPVRCEFQTQTSRFGLDHLENIIKLVEQLKELQENNYKSGERMFYLKDLKKLREYKKKLKSEEMEMRTKARVRSITTPEECERCLVNRKSSSTSEKLEHEPKENWHDKRKSICLGENRSKVSKWTKVKEAFHWEKTSGGPKTFKRENSTGEKNLHREEWLRSREVSPDESADVFSFPPTPPPPPPPPPLPLSVRPKDMLSVRPGHDFPSSSSSDRLDEILSFSELKENKTSEPDSPGIPIVSDDIDEVETLTRKFSCEELPLHLAKEDRLTKSNKTTWGKVKDIIQTRKDSLKKKPKKRGSDENKKRRKLSTVSKVQSSDQFEDLSSPEDKLKSMEIIPKVVYDLSDESSPPANEEKCTKRLTPALTVTLPSTEELRNFSFDDIEKIEKTEEDRTNILSQFSCQAQYCEDKSKFGKNKTGSNQKLSRWIKVKRVFLTSGAPARSSQFLPVSNSSPTSHNKSFGFFSDLESDDLSSGEFNDEKSPTLEKQKPDYSEPQSMTIIQEDIRKSYNELQKKLSQEFDQKLKEWEVKTETPITSSLKDDSFSKPRGDDGDCIPKLRKTRDSITVPLPNLNDLSPEFKKKLNDWKKMKTSQSSSSVSSSATKDEIQGQNIKLRIGEWQPWRNRCSGKGGAKTEQGLSEDYSRKIEEGQKGWRSSRPPANRRKDDEVGVDGSALRRGSKRRDSIKKISHSRTPSVGDTIVSSSSAENSGRFIRKSQKVKDFHWVEKELQKIEREKLRLEQEKEKYLEREARLEKMKKTMGASPTQEILVRTPEGFFRFKGISQKFTKKLYEWEKARGIAPEASTFALLEESAQTGVNGDVDANGLTMQRSKSTGSVPELPSTLLIQTMAHHPSSLSLNDVDELKLEDDESILLETKDANEEPEATIVDVEDIEEETAVLAEDPLFPSETPVYTYTSEEINQITDSKGRFYLSGEFGIQIMKESDANRTVEAFDSAEDCQSIFRNSKLKAEDSGRNEPVESSGNYLEYQNEEKIVEDAVKRFQGEDEKKTSEDTSRMSQFSSGYIKSKAKDIHEMKIEETYDPDLGIPKPALLQHHRDFPQCMGKAQTTSLFSCAKAETQELSFKKKSIKELARPKPDPQVLKTKIKEKITLMQRMSTEGSWKYTDFDLRKSNEEKNSLEVKIRDRAEELEKKSKLEKYLEGATESDRNALGNNDSINVFVQTTRKIISPVKTSDGATPSVCSYVIDDVHPDMQNQLEKNAINQTSPSIKTSPKPQDDSCLSNSNSTSPILLNKMDAEINPKRDIGMPPLPNSPKTYKKLNPKETAPSIRMIIAKYNQKISEHDSSEGKRTESGSPIWRSPVFGRRTQEKIEKFYGKDDGSGRKTVEVQKSASLDNMQTRATNRLSLTPTQDQEPSLKGILKSSSAGVMRNRLQNQGSATDFSSFSDPLKENSPSVLRALKIQKAKEEFLSGRSRDLSDASILSTTEYLPQGETPIKLTQLEVKPEQSLTKSVSAETITGETERSDSQSDAHLLQKSSSKFDISSIKSKFRKIRLRKEKDSKLNAVATLCRQSLFIEVPKASESSSLSKSCPSSPVMDRNKHDKTSQFSKK